MLETKAVVFLQAFVDDPLRMLRAYSIFAQFGFKIEKETQIQIKKDLELIRDVSYERSRDEVFKVLGSQSAFKVLKQMDRIGLLTQIIPQIRIMKNCKQGGYHHLDVWPHSLEVVNQFEKMIEGGCQEFEAQEPELFNDLVKYLNKSTC